MARYDEVTFNVSVVRRPPILNSLQLEVEDRFDLDIRVWFPTRNGTSCSRSFRNQLIKLISIIAKAIKARLLSTMTPHSPINHRLANNWTNLELDLICELIGMWEGGDKQKSVCRAKMAVWALEATD